MTFLSAAQRAQVRAALRRAELTMGRLQLETIEYALRTASRLTKRVVAGAGNLGEVAYFIRERSGALMPMCFIHGFGGDKETWLMVAPHLDRQRTLLMIDLPSHGESDAITGGTVTPARYVDAVLAALDDAGIERAIIIGNSFGGGVALHLAALAPERVEALVLVSSVGPETATAARSWLSGENPLVPRIDATASDDDGMAQLDAFMRFVTEKPPKVPKSILRFIGSRRAQRQVGLHRLFTDFVEARGGDAVPTADLGNITVPVLIAHGERDRVIAPITAHHLGARLPNSEVRIIPSIGHAPQLEAPRMLAGWIEQFAATVAMLAEEKTR